MTRALWTAEEVAAATGGRLIGTGFAATGVCFDSRSVEAGDLFVALAGARDGHDFVQGAFAASAAAALVTRELEGGPLVVVEDTLRALEALAVAARDRAPEIRRAAVTGSVGKTSVTQAIAAGLRLAGPAHSSIKSFNNHIGVPLTLARMPPDCERAVFEIGMNAPGEIAPLSRLVQPHAACVTTVGPVHIEAFADGEEGVAREKASIFDGLGPGGVAVINADNPWFDILKNRALHAGARIITFGAGDNADARLLDFVPDAEGASVSARIFDHDYVFRLRQSGFHWGLNALAVLMMLDALDVSLETGLESLSQFEPLAGRGRMREVALGRGHFTLIDESYNANPLSMRAGIASLGARAVPPGGRRIIVLTDMLELGEQSAALHEALAEAVEQAGIDLVFSAGAHMRHLHDAIDPARRGAHASSADEIAPVVCEAVREGDVVMVKGSNGSKAASIAVALLGLELGRNERGEG